MSNAFDTIQRRTLFEDLKEILTVDELNLIHLLLNDVKLAVKLEDKIGKLFIIYLAVSLKIAEKKTQKHRKQGSLSITTREHHQTTISA